MASFGEFELCLVDANGKPGRLMVFQAWNEAPASGDWVTLDGKDCIVLTVHHLTERNERTPRLRSRIYLKESTPPRYFERDDTGSSPPPPTPIRPGLPQFVSLPREQPNSSSTDSVIFAGDVVTAFAPVADVGEKKVRAVVPPDKHTATTVQRALSQSQVYEVFSAAVMKEALPAPRVPQVITTGGQVMELLPSANASSSADAEGHSTIQTTRQFELNSRDARPTLRLVRTARTTVPEGLEAPKLIAVEPASATELEPAQSTNLTTPDAVPMPAIVAEHQRAARRSSLASFAAPMSGVIILAVAVVFLLEAPYRREASSSGAAPPVSALPPNAGPAGSAAAHATAPSSPSSTAEAVSLPTSTSTANAQPREGNPSENEGAKVRDDARPLAVAGHRRHVKAKHADDQTDAPLTRSSSRSAASPPSTETRRPPRNTDDAMDPDF